MCRASLQELNLIFERPIIDLESRNSKLFIFVQNLSQIHKLRENLNHMRKYLNECRFAGSNKLVETSVGKCRSFRSFRRLPALRYIHHQLKLLTLSVL